MHNKLKIFLLFLIIFNCKFLFAAYHDTIYLCKNSSLRYISFNPDPSGPPPDEVVWSFSGGDIGSSTTNPSQSITYGTVGIFKTFSKSTYYTPASIFYDTFTIKVIDWPLQISYFPSDTGFCNGGNIQLSIKTSLLPYTKYEWNTGASTSAINVNTAGKYWLKTIIRAGTLTCDSIYKEVNVTEYPNPSVNLGQDKLMCQNQSMVLDAGAGTNYKYLWLPNNQTTRSITANIPDIYKVTVTTDKGCTANDEIELKDSCPHYVFVPNAFSPNEDRLNDIFAKVLNFTPKDYIFRIYNRWGELLFETTNLQKGWDGTFNNQLVQQDIYVYQIQYLDTDKKVYHLRGTFYVVR